MKTSNNIVFLIEDELDIMTVYTTALKASDINVQGFASGKEIMERIKEVQEGKSEKPALVLLDLVLPDINGLEILFALRNNEVTKSVPVFILSNYNSDALHNMTAIRPDKFLVKADTSPTQLSELVKSQLK